MKKEQQKLGLGFLMQTFKDIFIPPWLESLGAVQVFQQKTFQRTLVCFRQHLKRDKNSENGIE